jgi:hypothetical protein
MSLFMSHVIFREQIKKDMCLLHVSVNIPHAQPPIEVKMVGAKRK